MRPEVDWRLYLVTDRGLIGGRDLETVVERAVRGGVTVVQLREKECATREFIDLARRLKQRLAPYHVPLIINDRIDVALAAGADGVHVGQSDMTYRFGGPKGQFRACRLLSGEFRQCRQEFGGPGRMHEIQYLLLQLNGIRLGVHSLRRVEE